MYRRMRTVGFIRNLVTRIGATRLRRASRPPPTGNGNGILPRFYAAITHTHTRTTLPTVRFNLAP